MLIIPAMKQLDAYLARIGYRGRLRPDLETLDALMRAHLHAVPFENLDVQLGRPIDIGPDSIFDKLVTRRRGGWCYEQNGLFGWALREIGFDVTRLSGGVMREQRGDAALGNHLCLMVRLDRSYLVDVGFGGSLSAPIVFEEAEHAHAPFRLRLFETGDGYWRFEETGDGAPFSFDVAARPADEALLHRTCAFLQTDPASPFVQNLVVQQRSPDGRHATLRGRVLKELSEGGADKRLIETPEELVGVLRSRFGLDLPEAASLWPAIAARHETVFAAGAQS